MADEAKPADPAAPPQIQVQVDMTKMQTAYCNFFRLVPSSSAEEVMMDVGLHTGVMTPSGMEPITVTHRLVMNPYVAKRLMDSLRQIVQRHEQMFGALELDPQRRVRAGRPQG